MDTNLVQDTVLNEVETADNSGINAENNQVEQQNQAQGSDDVEKINAIVQKRTERYRKQNAELKDELATAKADAQRFKMLSNAMKKNGISSIEDQANTLSEYFGVGKDEFLSPSSNKAEQSKGDAYVDAKQFLETADEDEVIEEFDRLVSKRNNSKNFTAADNVRLKEIQGAYSQIRFNRDKAVAEKYCKDNGIDFNSVISDTDFIEFAKDLNVPISTAVKKFTKLSGTKAQPKAQPATTGSVKDTGGSVAKEYYTPEEVDKLSSKELDDPKIWAAVRKSMTKWKK